MLDRLLSAVGRAVLDAKSCLERQALEDYCKYYEFMQTRDEQDTSALYPTTRAFRFPAGADGFREIPVPEAALSPHKSMRLDEVRISLNISSCTGQEDGQLLLEVGPAGEGGAGGRLEFSFCGDDPAEGIARINQETMKYI